jgi:hypothetical protein
MASPTADLLRDIPEDVAMAREYAVLGAYDVALQYYDRAAGNVSRVLRAIVDSNDRGRWSKVRRNFSTERPAVVAFRVARLAGSARGRTPPPH